MGDRDAVEMTRVRIIDRAGTWMEIREVPRGARGQAIVRARAEDKARGIDPDTRIYRMMPRKYDRVTCAPTLATMAMLRSEAQRQTLLERERLGPGLARRFRMTPAWLATTLLDRLCERGPEALRALIDRQRPRDA